MTALPSSRAQAQRVSYLSLPTQELPPQKLSAQRLPAQQLPPRAAVSPPEPKLHAAAAPQTSMPTAPKLSTAAPDSAPDSPTSSTKTKSSPCHRSVEPFADAVDTARGKVPLRCMVLLSDGRRSSLFPTELLHNLAAPRQHNDPRQATRSGIATSTATHEGRPLSWRTILPLPGAKPPPSTCTRPLRCPTRNLCGTAHGLCLPKGPGSAA